MFEHFNDSARRTVVLAQEEARALNHNYVGTEHLLLAVIRDDGLAGWTLATLGVTYEARNQIVELIGLGIAPVPGHIPFLPAARTVIQNAITSALLFGADHINSGHLLHSLVSEDTSAVQVAGQAIVRCGSATTTVLDLITQKLSAPTAPPAEPLPGLVLSA